MIEQQAMIISATGKCAVVRIGRQSGCPVCDAGEGCGAGLFGRLVRRKPLEVPVNNPRGLPAGQTVQLGLRESLFLRLVLRLYGWPVLAALVGGLLGRVLALELLASPAVHDLAVGVFGLAAAGLALNMPKRTTKPDISSDDIEMLDARPESTRCRGAGSTLTKNHEV